MNEGLSTVGLCLIMKKSKYTEEVIVYLYTANNKKCNHLFKSRETSLKPESIVQRYEDRFLRRKRRLDRWFQNLHVLPCTIAIFSICRKVRWFGRGKNLNYLEVSGRVDWLLCSAIRHRRSISEAVVIVVVNYGAVVELAWALPVANVHGGFKLKWL